MYYWQDEETARWTVRVASERHAAMDYAEALERYYRLLAIGHRPVILARCLRCTTTVVLGGLPERADEPMMRHTHLWCPHCAVEWYVDPAIREERVISSLEGARHGHRLITSVCADQVLEYIAKHKIIDNPARVAAALGVPEVRLRTALRELVQRGCVRIRKHRHAPAEWFYRE